MRNAEIDRLETVAALGLIRSGSPSMVVRPVYIDPSNVTGNAKDGNPGTVTAPVLTTAGLAPFAAAWAAGLTSQADIFVMSPFPADAPMWIIDITTVGTGFVFIHGGLTTNLTNRHVGATQALVRSANQPMTITDTGGLDWTPYVGTAFVKITSGPNAGAMAEVRENLGAGRARLGEMFIPDPFVALPVVIFALAGGESFDVVTPFHFPSFLARVNGPRHQLVNDPPDLAIQNATIKGTASEVSTFRGTVIQMTTCVVDNASYSATLVKQQGVVLGAGSFHLIENSCQLSVYGGCPYAAFVVVDEGALGVSRDWGPEAGGQVIVTALGYCFGTELSGFNSDTPFVVEPGGKMQIIGGATDHILWGTGNTTTSVQVGADASFIVNPIVALVITGGASDFMLDDLTSLNGHALTWANLRGAGAFNGNAVAPNLARVVNSNAY